MDAEAGAPAQHVARGSAGLGGGVMAVDEVPGASLVVALTLGIHAEEANGEGRVHGLIQSAGDSISEVLGEGSGGEGRELALVGVVDEGKDERLSLDVEIDGDPLSHDSLRMARPRGGSAQAPISCAGSVPWSTGSRVGRSPGATSPNRYACHTSSDQLRTERTSSRRRLGLRRIVQERLERGSTTSGRSR